jgi:pSer/pThr/pTyr-binding forkhead associated (FHA) protein
LYKNLRRFRDPLSLHPQGREKPPTFQRPTQSPSQGNRKITDVSETHSISIPREQKNHRRFRDPLNLHPKGTEKPPTFQRSIQSPSSGKRKTTDVSETHSISILREQKNHRRFSDPLNLHPQGTEKPPTYQRPTQSPSSGNRKITDVSETHSISIPREQKNHRRFRDPFSLHPQGREKPPTFQRPTQSPSQGNRKTTDVSETHSISIPREQKNHRRFGDPLSLRPQGTLFPEDGE